jgi:hypothetical protein
MAFLALRLPILHSPRYFFFCWIWIILLYCDYVSTEIRRPQARTLLIILALVIVVQNVRSSIHLAETGRGDYARLVTAMKGPAPALYSLARPVFQQPVIDYFARTESVDITYLPRDRWCETKPEWLILDMMKMPAEASYGPTGCRARFRRVGIYPAWGFGVEPWGLYQILPP